MANPVRITFDSREQSIRVVVRPVRDGQSYFIALFMIVWTLGAAAGSFEAVRSAIATGRHNNLVALGLMAAIYAVILRLIGSDVLWRLCGYEEIFVTPQQTTLASRVLLVRRSESLATSEIKKIDWMERPLKWVRGTRRNLFIDVDGRRIELHNQLSLAEANRLTSELWPKLQELQRRATEASYRGTDLSYSARQG